ncbi:hypothetical protein KSF_107970 [Reticulibacter mediterranei]|uniref:Uncharacterized protein n=1 Tax=Reticulibacter mediterranei TaxID=2778369 RepID=A0A8J3N725_9CHLR|nr:hypothetical protein [Reticulibacter mediterranei]GHP00750.1 hypothetical protein KSF_107970 [Reticulibacter mediterranei]
MMNHNFIFHGGFSLTPEQVDIIAHFSLPTGCMCIYDLVKCASLLDMQACLGGDGFDSLGEIAVSVSSSDYLKQAPQLAQALADVLDKEVQCYYWISTGYRRLVFTPLQQPH